MSLNSREFTVIWLLGMGAGHRWSVQYVLRQIHHEPRAYYTFGDKLQFELRDYGNWGCKYWSNTCEFREAFGA